MPNRINTLRSVKHDDYTTVRYAELVRLRQRDLELTLLRMAIRKVLAGEVADMIFEKAKELDNDLPY